MLRQYRYVLYHNSGTPLADMITGEDLYDTAEEAVAAIPERHRLEDPDVDWEVTGNPKPKYGGKTLWQKKGNSIYYIQPVYVREKVKGDGDRYIRRVPTGENDG